jgi:DNA polymerase-1
LFDKEKAEKLILNLTGKMVELQWTLQDIFKPRYVSLGEFEPKRNDRSKGYVKGRKFTKVKIEEFNPSSRTQIVSRLIGEYGWNPEEFTEKGNVKMDEDIIENLPFKELSPLKEYLTIKKRISQIETGKQAWVKKVSEDSRIRGAIRQNGAVTGRAAHFSPNLAQVPTNESLYGRECRELFIVPEGKIMIGVDADALEMRCLAGYLTPYDNGRFLQSIIHGKKEDGTDPHSVNMHAYQIDNRDCAKTLFYADIFGAKNAKMGAILLEYGVDFTKYVPDFEKDVTGMLNWIKDKKEKELVKLLEPLAILETDDETVRVKKTEDIKNITKDFERKQKTDNYWRCWVAGKHCKKLFGDRIPEIQQLRDAIKQAIKDKGYIKGLDGRKLFCRSEHGALNTVQQSAGALIVKKAIAIADKDLQEAGFVPGEDYEFILWIHDELQLECLQNEEKVGIIKSILEESIRKAGIAFGFPAPMKGNSQSGSNWSLTH